MGADTRTAPLFSMTKLMSFFRSSADRELGRPPAVLSSPRQEGFCFFLKITFLTARTEGRVPSFFFTLPQIAVAEKPHLLKVQISARTHVSRRADETDMTELRAEARKMLALRMTELATATTQARERNAQTSATCIIIAQDFEL